MKVKLFEATQPGDGGNWGKFLVCQPDEEAEWPSKLPGNTDTRPLLRQMGYGRGWLWVLDWQTGEGVFVRHGGNARADLNKHRVWVCPMFEPFLTWLYKQDISKLHKLPQVVELDAEFSLYGYRRPGPKPNITGQLIGVDKVANITKLSAREVLRLTEDTTELREALVDIVDGRYLFWFPAVQEWADKNSK